MHPEMKISRQPIPSWNALIIIRNVFLAVLNQIRLSTWQTYKYQPLRQSHCPTYDTLLKAPLKSDTQIQHDTQEKVWCEENNSSVTSLHL